MFLQWSPACCSIRYILCVHDVIPCICTHTAYSDEGLGKVAAGALNIHKHMFDISRYCWRARSTQTDDIGSDEDRSPRGTLNVYIFMVYSTRHHIGTLQCYDILRRKTYIIKCTLICV